MNKPTSKTTYQLIRFNSRDSNHNITDRTIAQMKSWPLKYDVSLVSGKNKHITAHSFVLMLYSPKLRSMLEDCPAPPGHRIISLQEFSSECLEKMVQLFYAGEIQVTAQHLPELKRALQSMQVPDLNISLGSVPMVDGVKLPDGLSMTKLPQKRDLIVKPAVQPVKRMRADSVNPATIAKLSSLGVVTNVVNKSKSVQMTPSSSMQAPSTVAKQAMQMPPMRSSNVSKVPPNPMSVNQPKIPPLSLTSTNAENIQNNSTASHKQNVSFVKAFTMPTPNPQMKLDDVQKPTGPPPEKIPPKNLAVTDENVTVRVKKERIDIQNDNCDRNDGGKVIDNSIDEHRMTEIAFDECTDKENANPKDCANDIDIPHEDDMMLDIE